MSATADSFEKKSILFENRKSAEILYVRETLDVAEILNTLNIPGSQAAIIVGGSTSPFQPRLKNRLLDLISRGVGTFLAAIVSAVTAYLEYQQLEQLLAKYNLTKSSLESENQGWVQYIKQAQERGEASAETSPEEQLS